MKKIILAILISLVLISCTGCASKQDVLIETKYIEKECAAPIKKPTFLEYEALILEINGIEYYAFPKSEALKLITNWISYREWAEANYDLLELYKK